MRRRIEINFEKYRKADGSIDLYLAWQSFNEDKNSCGVEKDALLFLALIEDYQLIKSRQVMALALAQTDMISLGKR